MSGNLRNLEILASDITYLPSPEQRKAKEAFWVRFNNNPICTSEQISLSVVDSILGDSRLSRWWPQLGFKEWFTNREEFLERAGYLLHRWMDRFEELILNKPDVQVSAFVSAGKLLMEINAKFPTRSLPTPLGGSREAGRIDQMSREELEKFVRERVHLLPETKS